MVFKPVLGAVLVTLSCIFYYILPCIIEIDQADKLTTPFEACRVQALAAWNAPSSLINKKDFTSQLSNCPRKRTGKENDNKYLKLDENRQGFWASLQCRRFLRANECFCWRKHLVETPKERRKWGESKLAEEGAGRYERKCRIFFSPLPAPFLLSP